MRRGGAAALEPILEDAIDVLERKIQLLEQRGWFDGVEHRRDALDRLLPTIRAAATRSPASCIFRVTAERTGVSKDVLERESRATAPRREVMVAQPAAPLTDGGPGRPARTRRPVSDSEARLIQALFTAPDLIERAATEVPVERVERAELREIYTELLRNRNAASQLPMTLSESAQALWSFLKESAPGVVGERPTESYDRAAQILIARPEYRKMMTLSDAGERRRRRAELRTLYPEADQWYEWKRLKRQRGG